jgi:hypothetical protein
MLTLSYRLSRPCLPSLAGLTLWLLYSRYTLLCTLCSYDGLLIADLKFCFKLWKSVLEMHNTVFRDQVMRRTLNFEWFSWFKFGECLVGDCECSGSSTTDYVAQYMMKIHTIINESCNILKGCWEVRPLIWYIPANSMEDLENAEDLCDICASTAHCGQWQCRYPPIHGSEHGFGQQKHSLGLPTYLFVQLAACDLFPTWK